MKWIKRFRELNEKVDRIHESRQTESEVAKICRKYDIKNWTLNSDGLVDVDGDVFIQETSMTQLPLKFGTITGRFYCHDNRLTSLEGAPHTVGDNFSCGYNKLTSLKGSPHTVGEGFACHQNLLTSLEFAPKSVGGNFNCNQNLIRSFEGLLNIGGNFYCLSNPLYEIWKIIYPFSHKWDNEQMDFFNDLDIIRGEEIAIERFNFFLEEIGLEPVESVKGYKNIY